MSQEIIELQTNDHEHEITLYIHRPTYLAPVSAYHVEAGEVQVPITVDHTHHRTIRRIVHSSLVKFLENARPPLVFLCVDTPRVILCVHYSFACMR
jgi:hypothetical protein